MTSQLWTHSPHIDIYVTRANFVDVQMEYFVGQIFTDPQGAGIKY